MSDKLVQARSRSKKIYALFGAVGLLLAVLILALFLNPAYSPTPEAHAFVEKAIASQQKIEEQLIAYYKAGTYTFTEPLVIQDPYRAAPLTALLIFDTTENCQIGVHVPGKDDQSAVDYTFAGFQQHHEIPVYGLYAGTLNHITISKQTENGEVAQTEIDLQTESLPIYIHTITVDQVDPARYSPGFNFTFLDRKEIFDIDGNVRWYSTQNSWLVFTKLKNGRFLFTYGMDNKEGNIVMERDLLGKIYAIYEIPGGIHHDIHELPNGNLLITSSDLKSDTVEDYVIEVDRNNGHIVRSFDLKDTLDAARPRQIGMFASDWLHLNSIYYDPSDQTIIISSRAQSAVIKMTYPDMQIKWILGPHDNWSEKFQPYLLTPVGENFEWSWSQHHATLYDPDNSDGDFTDILLFDNGPYRSFDPASVYSPAEGYSRVVHYRINEASMTVEQVWQYGKENGSATFSYMVGSAYRLTNGNVLGTWGNIVRDALGNPITDTEENSTERTKVIEVDPSNSNVVFEFTLPDTRTYRVLRAGFYEGYSEDSSYTRFEQ